MASDEVVKKEIWNGKIPVLFRLCSSDVFLTEQPEPLYMAVMRQSYFPLVFSEKIHKYYKRYIDPDLTEANIWLEDINGMPVQWHWPIGVLFDLTSLTKVDLPWVMTVHYKDFPERNVIRFTSREAVESLYMSNLKEADFLKHRGQLINVMQRHEIKMLFQGLTEGNYEKFWSVNEKFMECSETNKFRYIPIRLHIKHDVIKQCLMPPFSKDKKPHTLTDLFNYFIKQKAPKNVAQPDDTTEASNKDANSDEDSKSNANTSNINSQLEHQPDADSEKTNNTDNSLQDNLSINSTDSNTDATSNANNENGANPPTSTNQSDDKLMNINYTNPPTSTNQSDDRLMNINYLTQGIRPPLDTPLLWLSRHLSYPDNFLHICLLDLPS